MAGMMFKKGKKPDMKKMKPPHAGKGKPDFASVKGQNKGSAFGMAANMKSKKKMMPDAC